jgi:hypothetical protein
LNQEHVLRHTSPPSVVSRVLDEREGSGKDTPRLHVAMSLDGFIAGPEHDMSWTGGAEYDLKPTRRRGRAVNRPRARRPPLVRGCERRRGRRCRWNLRRRLVGTGSRLDAHPEWIASDATVEAVLDVKTALARAEELARGSGGEHLATPRIPSTQSCAPRAPSSDAGRVPLQRRGQRLARSNDRRRQLGSHSVSRDCLVSAVVCRGCDVRASTVWFSPARPTPQRLIPGEGRISSSSIADSAARSRARCAQTTGRSR